MKARFFVLAALVTVLPALTANAELIVNIEHATFQQGGTFGALKVNLSSSETVKLLAFTADFTPQSGVSFYNPLGSFGETGMLGAGGINPSSDLIPSGGNANLVLDFDIPPDVTPSAALIATLNIDLDGLAPGDYQIAFSNVTGFSDMELTGSGGIGTFTVEVPEPSTLTLAVLGLGGFVGVTMLRRRRARKVAA